MTLDVPILTTQDAFAAITAGAERRDREPVPAFPFEAFTYLREAGALAFNATEGVERPPAADELRLVREVARADGSVGRIFDGHLNAVERLAVQAPADLRDRELEAVRAGELLAGVWGGDPARGEGVPAIVAERARGEFVLRGCKTFCSGAGGLQRALVLARANTSTHAGGPPLAAWVDLTRERYVEIDPGWYRAGGLRASVSHRVVFHDAPVLACFGNGPGALSEQPWFGRDALRTSASWVGMADAACAAALAELRARDQSGAVEALGTGRMLAAHRTIELWLEAGAAAMDSGERLAETALLARVGIADAVGVLLDEAARACGSRPFARGAALDRARRDLELFTLQHRLDPLLARYGTEILEER